MSPDTPPHAGARALDDLVAELLRCTAFLAEIRDHMARSMASGRCAPDAPPPEEVLAELLRGITTGLAFEHPKPAIDDATAVLAAVADSIADEILLVPLDEPPPSRRERRACRNGRRRR